MRNRTTSLIGVVFTVLATTCPAAAEQPAPTTLELSSRITQSLHPAESSIRDIEIRVREGDRDIDVWHGRQFRKSDADVRRVVTLLTSPPSVSGFAVLATGKSVDQDTYWIYVPPVRRVRRLIYEGRYENFLGTELSASDFGFFRMDVAAARVIGSARLGNTETWKLEETMQPATGYSRAVTWVDAATGLPLRRELYDTSGKLWKTQTRERIEKVGDVSVPLILRAKDIETGGETVLEYKNVQFGVVLDDALFTAESLPALGARSASIR
jgi:hypothetical protein